MNDLKQFFATKTGLVVCGILVLIIGVYIGSGNRQNSTSSAVSVPSATAPVAVATSTLSGADQSVPAPAKKTFAPVQARTATPTNSQTTSAPVVTQSQPVQPIVAPAPTPVTAPVATWHTAYTYSGSSSSFNTIKTPSFALQGKQQRIDYKCSIVDYSNSFGGSLGGTIQATQGYSSDNFASGVVCPKDDSTYEYSLTPGQYYLDIDYRNSSYTITVEDLY